MIDLTTDWMNKRFHPLIVKTLTWPDEAATQAFTQNLATRPALGHALLELRGDLGAGKTTFVRHLLKALGVTSLKRLPAFPDVPAIAEVLPGYESSAWFGLFGPGQMDPMLARRFSDAARQAIGSPDVRRRLEMEGAVPVGNRPDEFARFVQAEIMRWARVVKFSGAKPE